MPKGKKGKPRKEVDWAADANFDKNRSILHIEYTNECPIFHVKADELFHFLEEEIPERTIQLVRNNGGKVPPRPGTFEVSFSQNARTSAHLLWSGMNKGPPRRDKFPPHFEALVPEVRKILKKFYPDLDKNPEDELDDDNDAGVTGME